MSLKSLAKGALKTYARSKSTGSKAGMGAGGANRPGTYRPGAKSSAKAQAVRTGLSAAQKLVRKI